MEPSRTLTAGHIAELTGGRLIGSDDITIAGIAPLDRAGPGDLSFLATGRYRRHFEHSEAGVVLIVPRLARVAGKPSTRIVVDAPQRALGAVAQALRRDVTVRWGVHRTARIGEGSTWNDRVALGAGAIIGRNVVLGARCVLESHALVGDGARLGDDCRLGPHSQVGAGAVLGNRVVLYSGARVGTPGFGYAWGAEGHERLPEVGGCFVEDDVEVGANTTVDRGGFGDTVIGEGTKIDNLVQVAHNVRIGRHCIVLAQVGIAGSTDVEDHVILAGQAGLAGHLTVGRGARVAAQGGVIGDVPPGATVSGYPARQHREVLRQAAALKRLTPLANRLDRLARAEDPRA